MFIFVLSFFSYIFVVLSFIA